MKKDKNTCAVQYMFINKSNTNLVYNSNTDLIYKSDSDLVYKLNTDHICTNRIRILSTNRIWICMVYNWDPDLIYKSDKNLVCKFRNRLERVCNTSGNNIFRAYLIYCIFYVWEKIFLLRPTTLKPCQPYIDMEPYWFPIHRCGDHWTACWGAKERDTRADGGGQDHEHDRDQGI